MADNFSGSIEEKMKGLVIENKRLCFNDDLERPKPKTNEVLVKVICASVNPTDIDNVAGKYDLWLKLSGGYHKVRTGLEFSGVVVQGVGRFEEGDKVFGYVDLMKGQKTHQEYLCINPDCIALMPKNLDFKQAAALPLGSLTSLVALTEVGEVKQGTELLVNGASGGLGVYSLQLAKILGAHTAAIAGPGQESFLTGLGAKTVYNYKETKLESLSQTFDVILDLSNKRSFKEVKLILSAHGRFIPLEPNKHILSFFMNFLSSQKMKFLMVDKGNNEKLSQIAKWVEESKLKVFVDSVFSFADYEKAFLRMDEQGKRGRVVLKIAEDD